MKKFFLIVLFFLMAFGLIAGGQKSADTRPLKLGIEGADFAGMGGSVIFDEYPLGYFQSVALPQFERDTALEVLFHVYKGEAAQNIKIMDSDLVSDYPADVILSYGGRINRYSNYRYGVDLSKYLPAKFLALFKESALEPFQSEGIQYALPISAWATNMIVNKTLIERAGVGHLLPADDSMDRSWTVKEFTEMLKAVKALDDGSFGFFIIAAMTGGDYWILNLFAGFGAEYYKEGEKLCR